MKTFEKNYTTHAGDWSPKYELTRYFEKYSPLTDKVVADSFEKFAEMIGHLVVEYGHSIRGGKQTQGGGIYEDVRVALSCAAQIAIDVDYYSENARQFKDGSASKLRKAWLENDIDSLIYLLSGYERNASDSVVKHSDCEGIGYEDGYYEMEDEEVINPVTSQEMIDMAETLIMFPSPLKKKIFGGNWTRKREKLGTKPPKRENKQLTLSLDN